MLALVKITAPNETNPKNAIKITLDLPVLAKGITRVRSNIKYKKAR